jgi:hypothetical protein
MGMRLGGMGMRLGGMMGTTNIISSKSTHIQFIVHESNDKTNTSWLIMIINELLYCNTLD